jgi:S-phase kinase-associated protein 1
MLKLISSDSKEFMISREEGKLSKLIEDMISQNDDVEEYEECEEIPLKNIHSEQLSEIVEFLRYQANSSNKTLEKFRKPIVTTDISEAVEVEWYANFINRLYDKGLSYFQKFVLDVNFLNIYVLLHLTCVKFATMIKGKEPHEIRKTYNIPADPNDKDDEDDNDDK